MPLTKTRGGDDIIFLSILGGIFLLILLLLIIPLKLRFAWADDKLKLDIGWLFLWFDCSPEAILERIEKRAEKPVSKKPPKKPPKPKKKPRSALETLQTVFMLMRELKRPWNILRRHIVFSNVRIYLIVSGKDAHEAAVNYAKYSTVVFGLLTLVCQIFTVKKHEVFLLPDFTGRAFHDISFRMRIRPIFAVAAAVNLLFRFLVSLIRNRSVKVKGGKKYEPTESRKCK